MPHRKPREAEPVWTLRNGSKGIDAVLLAPGEFGWECQFRLNGGFVYGRRWQLRAEAIAEIQEHRRELQKNGWTIQS